MAVIDFSLTPIKKQIGALNASAFTNVILNTSASTLDFYDINGDLVQQFDASALIIDGMVESVTLNGNILTITFNTDAGKQNIDIDLTEFINPQNYYTKTETDNIVDSAYASAVTYVDSEILSARTDASAYTDSSFTSAVTYVDSEVLSARTDASAYTDNALVSAKTYTDNAINSTNEHILTFEKTTAIALNELKKELEALKTRITALESK